MSKRNVNVNRTSVFQNVTTVYNVIKQCMSSTRFTRHFEDNYGCMLFCFFRVVE